jgi:hypothetical protein
MLKKLLQWLRGLFGSQPQITTTTTTGPKRTLSAFTISNKVEIYNMERITPGKHHAWYSSSVGLIRKPIQ